MAAVEAGTPKDQVGRTFSVGLATVNRYLSRKRERGSLAPSSIPGRPRLIPPALEALLAVQVAEHNDATLAEHRSLWLKRQAKVEAEAEMGAGAAPVEVSAATVRRALLRVKLTIKKDAVGE